LEDADKFVISVYMLDDIINSLDMFKKIP